MEAEFSFGDVLPLPYRTLAFLQLGVLLWYVLVSSCYRQHRMNIVHLTNLSYSPHNYTRLDDNSASTGESSTTIPADFKENQVLLQGIKATFKRLTLINIISYISFQIIQLDYDVTDESTHNIIMTPLYHLLPLVTIGYNFYKLFGRPRKINSFGQFRVFTTIKRILKGNINSRTMRTNDILISDSLMSYSKVLNDLVLYLWSSVTFSPYTNQVEFFVLSIPSIIRMKQCYYEYRLTGQRQHLLNFIKYAIGIGPIVINLFIKLKFMYLNPEDENQISQDELINSLWILNIWWYFFSVVSSSYSFIWDVKMDWGFQVFDPIFTGTKPAKLTMLRSKEHLVYDSYFAYYGVILTDFVLRFIWVFKLCIKEEPSGYLDLVGRFLFGNDIHSLGYCLVETMEILRRWMWCFIKLESDWVKLQKPDAVELNSIDKQG